jgi:hypothetical protein
VNETQSSCAAADKIAQCALEVLMRSVWLLTALLLGVTALSGCSTNPGDSPFGSFPNLGQSGPPEAPARYKADEFVGRWGVASYRNERDRARTEAAARGQCSKAYPISKGPNGGVMMHLADQPVAQELRIKGSPDGKTFIGPPGEPGDTQDREVVSFDGRVLILRFVDPEVAGRFGNMLYVRCGPTA